MDQPEAASRRKDTIVTIHGINSGGEWQDEIRTVLEPHFDCVTIRYPRYRHFGAIKLFSDPWLLSLGLAAVGAHLIFHWLNSLETFAILLGCVFGGFVIAARRRSAALVTVWKQLEPVLAVGNSSHVIAHSFGTFLITKILMKWPSTRFRHIVLAGSVVKRTYGWRELSVSSPNSFWTVRNEIAGKDWSI